MSDLFIITEPEVKTKKGTTREAVIKTVEKNLQKRIDNDTAIRRSFNNKIDDYQDEITLRYGSKPMKVFWSQKPLGLREDIEKADQQEIIKDRREFEEAVFEYIPNLSDLLWETFKSYSKTNKKNAEKREGVES